MMSFRRFKTARSVQPVFCRRLSLFYSYDVLCQVTLSDLIHKYKLISLFKNKCLNIINVVSLSMNCVFVLVVQSYTLTHNSSTTFKY